MAQINLTMDREELPELIAGDREKALRHLAEKILDQLLLAESSQQLNADSYERALGRTDYRSGTRERHLVTRIGRLTLHVPRHRNKPFYILLFPSSITPQQPSVHPPACRCSAALCCRSSRQFFQ